MEENSIIKMNDQEKAILLRINKIYSHYFPEADLLEYQFTTIKLQGRAFLHNIMEIASLGIPLFTILASRRNQSVGVLIEHLQDGSINFYDIKHALNELA